MRYLIHLIGDQYWKTYIDPKFETEENGIRGFRLKNGKFHDNENWWGYFDSLKMQKQIARIYGLTKFPINVEMLINQLFCSVFKSINFCNFSESEALLLIIISILLSNS